MTKPHGKRVAPPNEPNIRRATSGIRDGQIDGPRALPPGITELRAYIVLSPQWVTIKGRANPTLTPLSRFYGTAAAAELGRQKLLPTYPGAAICFLQLYFDPADERQAADLRTIRVLFAADELAAPLQ